MSSRKKFIILVVALIVLIALILGFWLYGRGPATDKPTTYVSGGNANGANLQASPRVPLGAVVVEGQSAPEAKNADLYAFARSFVERYGSYSNQSNFENMEDLYAFMTERMKTTTAAFVKQQRQMSQGGSAYRGTTTHVLSVSARSQDNDSAMLLITTQRQESSAGSTSGRVFYQSIELRLLKEAAQWKVDEANWKG